MPVANGCSMRIASWALGAYCKGRGVLGFMSSPLRPPTDQSMARFQILELSWQLDLRERWVLRANSSCSRLTLRNGL